MSSGSSPLLCERPASSALSNSPLRCSTSRSASSPALTVSVRLAKSLAASRYFLSADLLPSPSFWFCLFLLSSMAVKVATEREIANERPSAPCAGARGPVGPQLVSARADFQSPVGAPGGGMTWRAALTAVALALLASCGGSDHGSGSIASADSGIPANDGGVAANDGGSYGNLVSISLSQT